MAAHLPKELKWEHAPQFTTTANLIRMNQYSVSLSLSFPRDNLAEFSRVLIPVLTTFSSSSPLHGLPLNAWEFFPAGANRLLLTNCRLTAALRGPLCPSACMPIFTNLRQ
ncbi:hypothetical protein ACTXT7_003117 [Hymenolepis weldensis]